MIAAAFGSTARFVWTRNRMVLLGCAAVYLAIFIAYQAFTPQQMGGWMPLSMLILRLVPFFLPAFMLISTVNVAALELGGREGRFPRFFFTLPIKTHEMVLPFVVYAVAVTALLWAAGAAISNGRVLTFGQATLTYWLPCMTTSLLVWFQALVWTPFARGWMRVTLIIAALLAHTVAMVMYLGGTLTQAQLMIVCLLQIPLAALVGIRGVRKDRSGNSPARPLENSRSRPLRSLPNGFAAQLWFERRIHRWNGIVVYALPAFGLLLFILAMFVGTPKSNPETFAALARVTINAFMWITIAVGMTAGFLFATFRETTGWNRKEAFTMPAFFAALPLSTGDFVWAKLTAMTTRVLWLSVLALLACGWIAWRADILNPGTGAILSLRQEHGDLVTATMLATTVCAFLLFLLSATASILSMSLAGRAWNWMNAVNFARYVGGAMGAVAVSTYWRTHHVAPPVLPDVVRVLAAMKIATLVVLVLHMGRTGLLSRNRLATLLTVWLATFATMLTATLMFLPEGKISTLTLVAFLILLAPVLGPLAGPLALHVNRVR